MRIAIAALLCTTALPTSAKERVVRWTTAETSKRIYKGRCPVQLVLTGTIAAARAGDFSYVWRRSDGAMGPTRTVHSYRRSEMWRVREVWEVSGSTHGWAQLWIPSEQRGSRMAHFRVQCN
jgi:hypothetical protein